MTNLLAGGRAVIVVHGIDNKCESSSMKRSLLLAICRLPSANGNVKGVDLSDSNYNKL
jgi:hypothetical protein